ncbi:MAG: nickel-dependent lactate racemase [bacterium]
MSLQTSAGKRISFGTQAHEISVPGGELASVVEPACPVPVAAPVDIIRATMANPVGCEPLRAMARGRKSAVILVPGMDRIAAVPVMLPCILEELNKAGIPDDGISVVVASGTHIKHTQDDIRRLIGDEAAQRLRCRQHECRPGGHLRRVGVTGRGTPVDFDGEVVDAGIRILTGRVIPHYFAGFGGGRKALLPGVASTETILHNHRLTLQPQCGIHPGVRPCSLRDNPVHLDMLEAARLAGPSFVLNTLLDSEHHVVGAVAGDLEAAHLAGCRMAEEWFKVELDGPVDAVITSAGGSPYDCDFVQALKAVFDVQDIVKPGGAILWVAECPGGMKEAFPRWAGISDDDELERAVREGYNLAGHNSIMLRRLVRRVRVGLWSGLPDDSVRSLQLAPVHSLREGLDWLAATCQPGFRYAVVPYGNVTHVTTRK